MKYSQPYIGSASELCFALPMRRNDFHRTNTRLFGSTHKVLALRCKSSAPENVYNHDIDKPVQRQPMERTERNP
jgi:hypothetical protein